MLRVLRRVPGDAYSLVNADLARALSASGYANEDDVAGVMSTERQSHAQGLSQPAYQLTLELADQSAAAFGIEPRYPFFDRRLIDFCLSVPDTEKFADGWPRLLFRRAMEGILPPDDQWRPDKGNLSPNFHRSFRAAQAVAPDPGPDSPLAPYVDIQALRHMRQRYCSESSTLARSADGHALFRAMVLEQWLSAKQRQSSAASVRSSSPAPAAA
jgi:asparagine synthase (glutamine-hydrolysing)